MELTVYWMIQKHKHTCTISVSGAVSQETLGSSEEGSTPKLKDTERHPRGRDSKLRPEELYGVREEISVQVT